jgi:hypothetical protein
MKYRLKRDLPFAKAGAEIFEGQDGFYSHDRLYANTLIIPFNSMAIQAFKDELIGEGWIEEAKPREFTLYLNHKGNLSALTDSAGHALVYNMSGENDTKIRLREVIE